MLGSGDGRDGIGFSCRPRRRDRYRSRWRDWLDHRLMWCRGTHRKRLCGQKHSAA